MFYFFLKGIKKFYSEILKQKFFLFVLQVKVVSVKIKLIEFCIFAHYLS